MTTLDRLRLTSYRNPRGQWLPTGSTCIKQTEEKLGGPYKAHHLLRCWHMPGTSALMLELMSTSEDLSWYQWSLHTFPSYFLSLPYQKWVEAKWFYFFLVDKEDAKGLKTNTSTVAIIAAMQVT